jgi:hypothetical protein
MLGNSFPTFFFSFVLEHDPQVQNLPVSKTIPTFFTFSQPELLDLFIIWILTASKTVSGRTACGTSSSTGFPLNGS